MAQEKETCLMFVGRSIENTNIKALLRKYGLQATDYGSLAKVTGYRPAIQAFAAELKKTDRNSEVGQISRWIPNK